MLLLSSIPGDVIPETGCVLVLRPVEPAEIRKALRSHTCRSAVDSEDEATRLTEVLETHVAYRHEDPPTLEAGHCHYLAGLGGLFHLSARRV